MPTIRRFVLPRATGIRVSRPPTLCEIQRDRGDGLGPSRCRSQIGRCDDAAALHVQHRDRLGGLPGRGVGGRRVVVDPKLGEHRQSLHEINQAVAVTTADVGSGNVMASGADPLSHPLEVGIGAVQPNVEDESLTASPTAR